MNQARVSLPGQSFTALLCRFGAGQLFVLFLFVVLFAKSASSSQSYRCQAGAEKQDGHRFRNRLRRCRRWRPWCWRWRRSRRGCNSRCWCRCWCRRHRDRRCRRWRLFVIDDNKRDRDRCQAKQSPFRELIRNLILNAITNVVLNNIRLGLGYDAAVLCLTALLFVVIIVADYKALIVGRHRKTGKISRICLSGPGVHYLNDLVEPHRPRLHPGKSRGKRQKAQSRQSHSEIEILHVGNLTKMFPDERANVPRSSAGTLSKFRKLLEQCVKLARSAGKHTILLSNMFA